MVEPLISDRIKFNKKGIQRDFILNAKSFLNLKGASFSREIGINQRTLSDWLREKLNMSHKAAKKIFQLSKIPIPKDHTIIVWNTYLKSISGKGGRAVYKKYGKISRNEEYRKEKWKQWWETTGRYKKPALGFQSLLKIKVPKKDKLLAEFVGIMLGDGGINKYFATVTLSSTEKQYILFVSNTINKLFGIVPKIYKHKDAEAVRIVINRKNFIEFCLRIGLVKGNKIRQKINIPEWVRKNREFSKVCVRGLVDTDGCFYRNSYFVKGKKYTYFKICFTSASAPLIQSVHNILMNLGLRAIISKTYREVRIVDTKSVVEYIKQIGSHNQKHLQKIKKWKNSRNMLK